MAEQTRLSANDVVLLREVIEAQRSDLGHLVQRLTSGDRLSAPEADALRGTIGDELVSSGIDGPEGDVNERGLALEALIDKVGAMSSLFDP